MLLYMCPHTAMCVSSYWTSHGCACTDLRLAEVLEEVGRIPLPPYLKREDDARDLASYQTPHASIDGDRLL